MAAEPMTRGVAAAPGAGCARRFIGADTVPSTTEAIA
jgi:hypothetical protein